MSEQPSSVQQIEIDRITIRFAGDSGDGMQLTGSQFTSTTAVFGNDISTLPDFPAEIRAPAGSLPGVSGFQISFASIDIQTPGDSPDVLVAMNPAALKTNLKDLKKGGVLIVNTAAFKEANLKLAGYTANPLEDGSISGYKIYQIDMDEMVKTALKDKVSLPTKEIVRCRNFFALGLMYWMYSRPMEPTLKWIQQKFGQREDIARANEIALKTGYNFGNITEVFEVRYQVPKAKLQPGTYRNMTGNLATALGIVAAAKLSGISVFYGSYPITPASDILHELSKHKNYGVKTFQAEDEIAAICTAIGASFAGNIGITGTSGPGVALKAEAIGLAVMTELPLLIINVQRGGPSTGLPTKTEQADLFQALYGRNGECPVPVVAAQSPSDCFNMAIEAIRIALRHMTPVFLLTDGYLANGSEPWKLPAISELPNLRPTFYTNPENFRPYQRDENLVRPWAIPGTPGLEHRIGGIEKANITGNVSYDPDNHENMCHIRADKVKAIANDIPDATIYGEESGDLLIVGWGSTYGAIRTAVDDLHAQGQKVSQLHLRYLNPFPKNLGSLLKKFKKVVVAEMNLGQLLFVLRAQFLVDAVGMNKVKGQPFTVSEIKENILNLLKEL